MWSLPDDHPGPRARDLVEPLLSVLTPSARDRILAIKESARQRGEPVQGIRIYQAVLEAGVTDYTSFQTWNTRTPSTLTHWRPHVTASVMDCPGPGRDQLVRWDRRP